MLVDMIYIFVFNKLPKNYLYISFLNPFHIHLSLKRFPEILCLMNLIVNSFNMFNYGVSQETDQSDH